MSFHSILFIFKKVIDYHMYFLFSFFLPRTDLFHNSAFSFFFFLYRDGYKKDIVINLSTLSDRLVYEYKYRGGTRFLYKKFGK